MFLGAIPCAIQRWHSGQDAYLLLGTKNSDSLCCARQRTELKHISKSRWRKQIATSLVAASEKGRAGPESSELWDRLADWAKRPERV